MRGKLTPDPWEHGGVLLAPLPPSSTAQLPHSIFPSACKGRCTSCELSADMAASANHASSMPLQRPLGKIVVVAVVAGCHPSQSCGRCLI